MWISNYFFVAAFVSSTVGDQHKYIFDHEKFALEYLNTNVAAASAELYNVGQTMALNASFKLKIDLPDDSKIFGAALRWRKGGYGPPLIQLSKPIKQALDMTVFDLDNFITKTFRPPIVWPIQKGVTYQAVGWTPDVTKFPPNLPSGK